MPDIVSIEAARSNRELSEAKELQECIDEINIKIGRNFKEKGSFSIGIAIPEELRPKIVEAFKDSEWQLLVVNDISIQIIAKTVALKAM